MAEISFLPKVAGLVCCSLALLNWTPTGLMNPNFSPPLQQNSFSVPFSLLVPDEEFWRARLITPLKRRTSVFCHIFEMSNEETLKLKLKNMEKIPGCHLVIKLQQHGCPFVCLCLSVCRVWGRCRDHAISRYCVHVKCTVEMLKKPFSNSQQPLHGPSSRLGCANMQTGTAQHNGAR